MSALAAVLLAAPVVLLAFQDGPLPGFTGGFGERNCRECHFDNSLNDAAGSLGITGVPAVYEPGQHYTITVTLRRPDVTRGGFELASRFDEGARKGREAGTLTPSGPRMKVIASPDGALHYIQHTKAGSETTTAGALSWAFDWQAPAGAAAAVRLSAAGNASNADSSPLGDFVYTTEARAAAAHEPAPPRHRAPW